MGNPSKSKEDSGRINLRFNLADVNQCKAYEILQSKPYRSKSKYITELILNECNQNSIAETIAKLILANTDNKKPATAACAGEKRKRGRPRKIKTEESPRNNDIKAAANVVHYSIPSDDNVKDGDFTPTDGVDSDMLESLRAFG